MGQLSDFSVLNTLFGASVGSWYELRDEDSGIGVKLKHPWMLLADSGPRTQFIHACLRTTSTRSASDPEAITHERHDHGTECLIDLDGWIVPRVKKQLPRDCLGQGRFSCMEPDEGLVDEILRRCWGRTR